MTSENIQEMVIRNREEYSDFYDSMEWLNSDEAEAGSRTRKALVDSIFGLPEPKWAYSNTKLYIGGNCKHLFI